MKTRAIKYLFALSSLLSFSCKKESNNTGSTGSGSNSGAVITTGTASRWYGMFIVSRFHEISSGPTLVYSMAQVNFYKQPEQFPNNDAAMVDSVYLNGIPMQFWPFQDSSYVDTVGLLTGSPTIIPYPYTYKVIGKGLIPSFTYTENGPFPDYTASGNLPDTIAKSNGAFISLGGAAGADYLMVDITSGQHYLSHVVYPPFPATNNFTSAELAQLDTFSHANIQVILIKSDNKNVNNKSMLFSTGCNYSKTVFVK